VTLVHRHDQALHPPKTDGGRKMQGEPIHVLIAHANSLVSAGLRAAFAAQEDFRLAEFGAAGPEPLLRASRSAPLVAITDCSAGMRILSAQNGTLCRVMILTDDMSEVTIRRALELGACGYLPLSSRPASIVGAVRNIHYGGTAIAPRVMLKMMASLRSAPLSSRELEVLRMIMQGLSDKAIARQLQRSVATAKTHVKGILTKLDVSSRVEAIVVARRRGLVHEEPSGVADLELTHGSRQHALSS